jgi:hypothetical protein
MNDPYILKGHEPVSTDLLTWGKWMKDSANRRVAETIVAAGVRVSTVFLGLNHSFTPRAQPILFETMIFDGSKSKYQERYCTWDEAEAGHERAVVFARATIAAAEPK